MTDFLLDQTTNDMVVISGNMSLASTNQENLQQKLSITFQAWVGEWLLNTSFGIPYRQSIFGERIASKDEIDAIFIAKTNEKPEVSEILEFESEFDKTQRKYEIIRLVVRTTEGIVLTFSENNPDDVTYNFIPAFITSLCDDV